MKIVRIAWAFFLILWVLVSLAAFAGMYKLWWERERVEYFGKTVTEQRRTVFQHAGIPQSYLSALDTVNGSWPEQTHYSIQGQQVQGSYLSYLLIPHVPTGDESYALVFAENVIIEGGIAEGYSGVQQNTALFPAQGFLVSLLSLSGIVLLFRHFTLNYSLSVPELFAVVCLFAQSIVVLSKVFFQVSTPAFYLLLFSGLIGWIVLVGRRGNQIIRRMANGKSKKRVRLQENRIQKTTIWIGCFLIALGTLWVILMSVIVVPDDWDAWAIWGAKAKVLALAFGSLKDVAPFGHADYPLLWPSIWAFSGWCGGGWDELWSRGWGAVFMLLCCWEIAVIVQRNTKRWDIGLLAGALFISIPLVPLVASWSYAEAPFWLMMVSCFGCLSLWQDSRFDFHLLWAALLAVAAAYTKNEGILFFIIAAAWVCCVPGRRLRSAAIFLSVFLVCYAPWYYWIRIVSDFGSHATTGLALSTDALLRALDRTPKAFEMISGLYGDIRQWNLVLWGLGLGWLVSLWSRKTLADMLMPAALLFGYFLIVVFHQADIYWQVGTSWNRLTVQVIPLLIVVVVPGIWKTLSVR